MAMGKKHARLILTKLQEIRRASRMERADFSGMYYELPKSSGEVTAFVKETTRLYRTSWITEPLNGIINELNEYI